MCETALKLTRYERCWTAEGGISINQEEEK